MIYWRKTYLYPRDVLLINYQSIDNDCYTDDGQIKGAIIKLYRNMESSLKELIEPKKTQEEEQEENEIDLSTVL